MYPALPRWSDAGAGGGGAAAAASRPRPTKPSLPPRNPPGHVENGPSSDVLPPALSTRPSASPATAAAATEPTAAGAQTKKASRSGQLFVNHNTAPPSPPAAAGPAPPSASSALSTSPDALPGHGPAGGRGHFTSHQPHNRRGGRPAPVGPAYATNRQGVVRGTTVTNALAEAARHGADGITATAAQSPLTLGVEGVQTGEEVLVDSTAALAPRRRSFSGHQASGTGNGNGSACSNPLDHVQLPQLKRQLEKTNTSLKSLTAASRRQKQEHDAQRAEWGVQLAECEARLRAVLTNERERENLIAQLIAGTTKTFSAETQKKQGLLQTATKAHEADTAKWDIERAALRRELEAAQASATAAHAADSTAAAVHQGAVEELRTELEALRQSTAATQLELETALADAQSKLNKANVELQGLQHVQQQCNYLVQQCRLFIRQVCQPGFSVVKGPSLEPVEKDRPEPTGFVLVPLTVLLHGYTLLPEDDRQEVIDHYDKEAKALK